MRGKLLAAATKLFHRRGYASTSVREIVAAAGVTKPVLYHYFGSKEELYLEIARHLLNHFEEQLAEFRRYEESASERIFRLCDAMFSLFLDHIDGVRLLYSMYYGPPQGAPHFDCDVFYAKLIDALEQAVRQGIRSGEFCRGKAQDMAQAICGVLFFAIESHLAQPPVYVGNEGLRRILRTLFHGILSAKSKRKGKHHAVQAHPHSSSGTMPRRRKLHA